MTIEELKMLNFLDESVHSVSCYIVAEFLFSSAIKKIAAVIVPERRYMTSLSAVQANWGAVFVNLFKKHYRIYLMNKKGHDIADLSFIRFCESSK